jgi:hypothetical protein
MEQSDEASAAEKVSACHHSGQPQQKAGMRNMPVELQHFKL